MNGREKLVKIMQTEGLNAKQFAAEVGIQAGTISNIINGRNNASLEVMQKVLRRYENISAEWLVADRGSMYRPIGELTAPTPSESENAQPQSTQTDTLDTTDNATVSTATAPSSASTSTSTFVPKSAATSTQPISSPSAVTLIANVDNPSAQPATNRQDSVFTPAKQIEKIVIFYSDGTYENFHH